MKSKSLVLSYDKKHLLIFINTLVFIFIIFMDRLTKRLALTNYFSQFNSQFLSFDLTINKGISCGILHSENNTTFFLISFMVLIIIVMLLFHIKSKIFEKKIIIGEVLIASGAISNFIDRIFYNGVVDFIVISFNNWSFPVFNIADMSIVIGTMLVLFIEIF